MAALFQFENYLEQLKKEIDQFSDDDSLWKVPAGISNSPGNLAIHIAGNLQHFVGAILGNSGYIRKRDEEFSAKGLKKEQILHELNVALIVVRNILNNLSDSDKMKTYPEDFKGKKISIDDALSHLLAHLAYHTGQINYLRRITAEL